VAIWAPEQVTGVGDREIARIAVAQKGLVLREQLLAAGLGRGAIAHRLENGRLHPVYRGVYLVGRASMEPLGEEMAAVLRFRGHAIMSHDIAAWVWGMLETRPKELTLTIVGVDRHSEPGLRLCRVGSLDRRDLRARSGLPLTAPARTLVDLAATPIPNAGLEQALALAGAHRGVGPRELEAALERAPGRTGVARVRRLLATDSDPAFTRSRGERQFLALIRSADLPQPVANAPLLGYEIDFLWPRHRIAVEVDSRTYHSGRVSFEKDRRRDQRLAAAGYLPMRVSWDHMRDEPLAVVARVAQVLAQRREAD
jgi:very-short-patch-repair endonuclease